MKIYGANLSPYVRKVLAVARLKGLEYAHEPTVPGSDDPDFLKISPLGKIPALEDGDLRIPDSTAICEYFEEIAPSPPALPATATERARCRWIEEFADTKWTEIMSVFFFERKMKALFKLGETDEARLAKIAAEQVPRWAPEVEGMVPGEGYLFGGELSVADIALVSPTVNAAYAEFTLDPASYPRTCAHIDRVRAHPAFAAALEAERPMAKALLG